MVITIHQPEHFPYMGFFHKMRKADAFVILDDVKFKKNNWQNRNKFLNSTGEEEWFTVPIQKKHISRNINEVFVSQDKRWRKKLLKQLKMNLKVDLQDIYDSDKIIDINMKSIEYCCEKLKIETPLILSSDLKCLGHRSEKLVNICKNLGATTYLSGPSGKNYLDADLFESNGIKIDFFEPQVNNYYSALYNIYIEGLLDE